MAGVCGGVGCVSSATGAGAEVEDEAAGGACDDGGGAVVGCFRREGVARGATTTGTIGAAFAAAVGSRSRLSEDEAAEEDEDANEVDEAAAEEKKAWS